MTNRYKVFDVWGEVPEQVRDIVGKEDAFLLYSEYLGKTKDETIVDLTNGQAIGGWTMRYAGKRP